MVDASSVPVSKFVATVAMFMNTLRSMVTMVRLRRVSPRLMGRVRIGLSVL